MNLDLTTVMVMTGAVVTTVGVVFVTDMLRRNSEGAGRLWALSFLAGMLTIVCYAAWGGSVEAWWALAIGNAAFTAVPGIIWVGARRYNEMKVPRAALIVFAGALLTAAAVPLAPNADSPWAGVEVMFVVAATFAFLAAGAARRNPLRQSPAAGGLAVMMTVGGVYYIARLAALIILGPDSPSFDAPFGQVVASIVTCVITIVTCSMLTVILAEQRTLASARHADALVLATDGVFDAAAFRVLLRAAAERATARGESAAVISVRMDDLSRIATAFGSVEAEELRRIWRTTTRAITPSDGIVGEDAAGGLLVLMAPASQARARATSVQIRRGVHDAVMAAKMSVVPTVRVGVAVVGEQQQFDGEEPIIANARSDADADRNA